MLRRGAIPKTTYACIGVSKVTLCKQVAIWNVRIEAQHVGSNMNVYEIQISPDSYKLVSQGSYKLYKTL